MIQAKEDKYRKFWGIVGIWTNDRFGSGTTGTVNKQNFKHHWVIAGVHTDKLFRKSAANNANTWNC